MWLCSSRFLIDKKDVENSFTYPVYYDGIYSVIFNPDRIEKPVP
jgi:hypothetical protein